MPRLALVLRELGRTASSLLRVAQDWFILRTPIACFISRERTFAFLVHPRTDDLIGDDVYGYNDIYRPVPIFRHLFKLVPARFARALILGFARAITPATLSRISVRVGDATFRGYLLTSARTPAQLIGSDPEETRRHLADLFSLANRKGVRRVGLGALLPSMTNYGRRFVGSKLEERPAVSTGHAYTAYAISQYLDALVVARNANFARPRVAIVGAGGSTGKALMRVLKRTWIGHMPVDLLLVDVRKKEIMLRGLAEEARKSPVFSNVRTATDLSALVEAEYVVVVTNASGSIIQPEHLRPGTVVIDDSQPRNTSIALRDHGCHVLDVLARVPGLDCHFDFGFQTDDRTVTFTCLAETVLATVAGDRADLAVGEVTDKVVDRLLEIVQLGKQLGLIGSMPLFSFGRELTDEEQRRIMQPSRIPLLPAAE